MSKTLTKTCFVIYDRTRQGFVTGYVKKGLLHGLAKDIQHAKNFKSKKLAKKFIQKILKNLDFLACKESYKQKILDYNDECFDIIGVKNEHNSKSKNNQ